MSKIEPKVIETDLDTSDEEGRLEGGIYPFDMSNAVVELTETPFSVFEYLRRFSQGRINAQPDFQRNLVWTIDKKSRFIESIILNFPIPPIYLNERLDASYIVIDGLQRTTTLNEYYNNMFPLTDLQALPKLNAFFFRDLPPALQSKFEDKKINIYNIKPSTPMPIIYDLFNRINTGGTQLNRQEVRNCIFIGKSTRLLKRLSEEDFFKRAIDFGVNGTRMKDREVILRYISFRWFDFENDYSGDMSDFLEKSMIKINSFTDQQIKEIEADFERVMKLAFKIWGNSAFRIPTDYTRGTINTAVFESVSFYLAIQADAYLKNNAVEIKKKYNELLDDDLYLDSVTRSTGNKARVLTRFSRVFDILKSQKK